MARQAKSKVTESWLKWLPFLPQVPFLQPPPALCSSTSKNHSSSCHFFQTRVIRDHKTSHNPYSYTAQFGGLLCPNTFHFPPNVQPPPLPYSKAISSTAGSAKPGFMIASRRRCASHFYPLTYFSHRCCSKNNKIVILLFFFFFNVFIINKAFTYQ